MPIATHVTEAAPDADALIAKPVAVGVPQLYVLALLCAVSTTANVFVGKAVRPTEVYVTVPLPLIEAVPHFIWIPPGKKGLSVRTTDNCSRGHLNWRGYCISLDE